MSKPVLAILTDSIRNDNHRPLSYFKEFDIKHFYNNAPYGDIKSDDLANAIKWENFSDLEQKLLELKPDLIQGAEPYASRRQLRMCLLVMKVAKRLNVPYIFPMFENRPVEKRFGKITGYFLKKILKKYGNNAVKVFYLNEGAKRNLLEAAVREEKLTRELYGVWGVDTELFKPDQPYPADLSGKYILFVSRFEEAKGVPYLLPAWNSIKNQFPGVNLVFVGKGNLDSEIEGSQIIKLGLRENNQLPSYFANAMFSLMPSVTLPKWEEQVGTVNLQSIACGTPVITTSSGAIPEYVSSEVGVLVPERDSKALAEAMENLLKNEELRKNFAKNCRPYILDKFDAQKNIEKIEKILLELI